MPALAGLSIRPSFLCTRMFLAAIGLPEDFHSACIRGCPTGMPAHEWLAQWSQVFADLPNSAEGDDFFGRALIVLDASRHTVCRPLTLRQTLQPKHRFDPICEW